MDSNMKNRIIRKALLVILLVSAPALLLAQQAYALPGLSAIPNPVLINQPTNLSITPETAAALPDIGDSIAVYDPSASPTFNASCPLPGAGSGRKWVLMAGNPTSGWTQPVGYTLTSGGEIDISDFGENVPDNETVNVIGAGSFITPNATTQPGVSYRWVDQTGANGTDSTNIAGNYVFATCGTNTGGAGSFGGGQTFTVINPSINLTKSPSSNKVENGATVTYTYNVTNTGSTKLTNVSITDNTAVTPNPITSGQTLNVSEMKTFTATAVLTTNTTNTATATGNPNVNGIQLSKQVNATANAFVRVIHPNISLSKTPSSTQVASGSTVTYTYNVTNTGDVNLNNVDITDNTSVTPNPVTSGQTLNVSETKTFTATAVITTDTTNVATTNGTDQTGAKVSAQATAFVKVIHPSISLSKTPSSNKVENGATVTYTYNVTNTGSTKLTNVSITDNTAVTPNPITSGQTLNVSEMKTFTATAVLTTNTTNTATATGNPNVNGVQLSNQVNATANAFVRVIHPNISLTKTVSPTSGTAPLNVTYTYTVNNTGDTALSNVTITDNVFGAVGGPITLNLGASQTFTKNQTITANTTNIATATGTDQFGVNVTANATATVTVTGIPPVGNQGCTPGFWKNNALKHGASQWPANFTPNETLAAAGFANATVVNLSNTTLLQALQFKGGPGLGGAEQILLRAAVSSLLNSATVKFPLTTSQVLSEVNTALATQNRDTILALANQLDAFNNLNCTLSQT